MADKPNMRQAWANQGTAVPPAADKIDEGWVAEKPPFENENWLQNRSDVWMQSTEERGVPEWDSSVPYNVYALCWYNNMVWRALQAHTNIEPGGTTPGYWIEVDYSGHAVAQQNPARLSYIIATTHGNDWNNVVDSGFYSDDNTASNRPGQPSTTGTCLVVVGANQNNVTQIYHDRTFGGIYYRNRVAGTWGDWAKLADQTYVDNADTTITNGYQNADTQIRSDFTNADAEIYRYFENSMDRTWQDVTSSRNLGTAYTNNTGVSIQVSVSIAGSSTQAGFAFINVGGNTVARSLISFSQGSITTTITAEVPPGETYTVSTDGSPGTPTYTWDELRP